MQLLRNDITILRAISVLSVILFHAKIPYFEGGYLGVDVFFVISGFLIYGNINKLICENKFSFADFYISRMRRLLPALLTVVLFSTLFSLVLLLPYDLKNYGQSVVATVISANNILLYLTSGYWSTSADFKALYHTWSLAVEEQFYFFGPILFLFVSRYIGNPVMRMLIYFLLLLVSLYGFLYQSNREYAFLMPHTRAWELIAGVISFNYYLLLRSINNRFAFILSSIGFLLIFISIFSESYLLLASPILAVIGASVVLIFPISKSIWSDGFKGVLFSPLIFIGLISYSLYLWHQPVLAFTRYISIQEPGAFSLSIAFLIISALSFLTWKFVENPLRDINFISRRFFIVGVLLFSLILMILGLILNYTYGFRKLSSYDYGDNPQEFVDSVKNHALINLEGKYFDKNVIVIGNSFARDFINVLKFYGPASLFKIKYYQGGCELLSNENFRLDLNNSKYIFYSENWAQENFDISDIHEVIFCQERIYQISPHSRVTIVGVKNFGWSNGFVRINSLTHDFFVTPRLSVQKFNSAAVHLVPGYLDVLGHLKNKDEKVPIFDQYGNLLTYDTNHLTLAGAKYVSKQLHSELNNIFEVSK